MNVTIEIEGEAVAGSVGFAGEVERHGVDEPEATVHGDDIFELLFTSGTTSMPKAVMLSHVYAYLASHGFALSFTRGLELESQLCVVTFLPVVYHIGDQVLALPALISGGKLVIGRRSNPEAVADAVIRHAATAVWGGSPQSIKQISLALQKRAPLSKTLTVMFYGWGAVEPEVLPGWNPCAGRAFNSWAYSGRPNPSPATASGRRASARFTRRPAPRAISSASRARCWPRRSWTRRAPISYPNGRANEAGEAVYRSPVMMAGYYRDPEATARAFEGGWFHSGDSCLVTDDGVRVMIDRYKDIIKSGGENVSSMRVEARLHAHPAVFKSAVVGLAHQALGRSGHSVCRSRQARCARSRS